MTQSQIELQNALTTTFLANLAFLSEYDNKLYEKIDELSRMIEDGRYKEKYALEFIIENGEFDIYDIMNDKYLYNRNPKKKYNELIRNVEFNEKNSILNIEEIFTYKEKYNVQKENRFNFNTLETIAYTSNQMQYYKDITKDYLENKKKRLKEIKKFIFLGTLLGRHIPSIEKKIDAQLYLVLEKNLEIFRLSLFTVDYTVLAKKGVIFSIMDNSLEEEKKIELFLNIYEYDNYLLKFSTTGINIDDYISKILALMTSNKPTIYDHNRKIYIHLNRTVKRISEKYNILQFNKLKEDFIFLKNIPILYIAAGPSIDENINWIKQNQNKFFIVSIGAAYKKLLENNIRVDIISTLDEKEILDEIQFNNEIINKLPNHTIIFASTITHEKILNKFDKNKIFLFEIFRTLFINNIPFNGYSVGEITLDILIKLNPKEIYLIGLDLSLNQNTGDTHSKDSNSELKIFDINKKDDRNKFGLNISTLEVKGNFKKSVITTALFYTSINFLEQHILQNKRNDLNIYNLSLNGAHFNNTIPLNIERIDIHKLKELNINFENLKNILKSFSRNELDNESKQFIKSDIENISNTINKLLYSLKKHEYNTFNDFYENCSEDIFENIKSLHFDILSIILKKYYLLVIPYLTYYFNERNIKDERKKLNKIKNIFIKQVEDILNDSLNILNKI